MHLSFTTISFLVLFHTFFLRGFWSLPCLRFNWTLKSPYQLLNFRSNNNQLLIRSNATVACMWYPFVKDLAPNRKKEKLTEGYFPLKLPPYNKDNKEIKKLIDNNPKSDPVRRTFHGHCHSLGKIQFSSDNCITCKRRISQKPTFPLWWVAQDIIRKFYSWIRSRVAAKRGHLV